ncbi:MAG: YicC/YloC family endoribonuclease [Owenweeksia sp.]|nr:YicC/YloC family endoribonuclease [Owenweeksia sp.]
MAHIYSMTGFGKASKQMPGKKITIEVKSLNSKQLDMNIRTPQLFREKEPEIRQMVAHQCGRGKVDFNFYCEVTGPEMAPKINIPLVENYLKQLQVIMADTGMQGDALAAVMRLPDITQAAVDEIDAVEWQQMREVVEQALAKLGQHRADEGETLRQELSNRVGIIRHKLNEVEPHEGDRVKRIKEKLQRSLSELKEKIDENRFEQELIYYLEKLDVTEEKVRLKTHLDYFEELLSQGGQVGKKLGFMAQEMGREINTLGSKANHSGIQKLVVEMKDELEKIKEQALNIL